MPWVQLTERHWYVRDGTIPLGRLLGATPFPFRTYNWGPLWRELRARVPESVEFRSGTAVTSVASDPGWGEVRTSDGSSRYDLVIGADGYRSVVREAVCPDVRPTYAGYLVWRGAYPESRLPDPSLWEKAVGVYAVFPGGHVVIYRIPDAQGGHRVNWVLYTAPPPGLDIPLTMPTSLPPGTLSESLHAHLDHIRAQLPPYWSTLIGLTAPSELFVQPMYDFTATPGTTAHLALTGDAATVARPHTGAGAVKALQDAWTLESALRSSPTLPEALRTYDRSRTTTGRTMVDLGRHLGRALVTETPHWPSLDAEGLRTWWERADAAGVFGGRELKG